MPVELQINTRESDTGSAIRTVNFFNSVKINLKYDCVASTFAFDMYFDPNNKEHAEIVGISHYHEAILKYVHDNGKKQLLITGYILSQNLPHSSKPELISIGGYSKPGLIEDCDIPTSLYPLESNGLTFRQIVNKVLSPFGGKKGIKFVVRSDKGYSSTGYKTEEQRVDAKIEKSTAPESKNIKSYLTDLATQKNLVLSHTPEGNLLVTTANTDSKPIFEIDIDSQESIGYVSMNLNFNGQGMHSHITVIQQANDEGGNAATFTIQNPLVPIVYRTKVVNLTSGNDLTAKEAAINELSKELKNVNLVIVMDRATYNNTFVTPNETIVVRNRKVGLYKKTRWFIEAVEFEADTDSEKVTITCVLPWTYNYYALNQNGKRSGPYNIFIDPHKNLPDV